MTPNEVVYESSTSHLNISWDDGTTSQYPCWVLRGFCPCAHCQGHGGGPPLFKRPMSARATQINNVTAVGNYGMCVIWEDGHDTAIYSFDWLTKVDLDAYRSHDQQGTFPAEGTALQSKSP